MQNATYAPNHRRWTVWDRFEEEGDDEGVHNTVFRGKEIYQLGCV